MKKTTKKLNIKKETVNSFTTLSEKEKVAVNGGAAACSYDAKICVTYWDCDFTFIF